jgi:hypothetical protein
MVGLLLLAWAVLLLIRAVRGRSPGCALRVVRPAPPNRGTALHE